MTEKRYNAYLKKRIELKEGEEFCPKCGGKGTVPKPGKNFRKIGIPLVCSKCFGTGKLDWVDNIVGKKRRSNIIMNGDFEIWQR